MFEYNNLICHVVVSQGGFCKIRWRCGAGWRAENQSISITTFRGELLKMRATPRHRATYVREILYI